VLLGILGWNWEYMHVQSVRQGPPEEGMWVLCNAAKELDLAACLAGFCAALKSRKRGKC
jgi:hypothetical protein